MPYIEQDLREQLDPAIDALGKLLHEMGPGQVNYALTRLVHGRFPGDSYYSINAALGVFEGAKLEYYRKVAGPHEDIVEKKNGEVY